MLHLINSGPATLDGTGQQTDSDGKPTMKPFWDIGDEDAPIIKLINDLT